MYRFTACLSVLLSAYACSAQQSVPKSYSNIYPADKGGYYLEHEGKRYEEIPASSTYTLSDFAQVATGTEKGLSFSFPGDFEGTLYYGFIAHGDGKHPQPVYFKRTSPIKEGKAAIDLSVMTGKYDMVGWQESGFGDMGYRVMNSEGLIVYDGRISFTGKGPFQVATTLIEGPAVNQVQPRSVVLTYQTNQPVRSHIRVNKQAFKSNEPQTHHELTIDGLDPATDYAYTVVLEDLEYTFSFRTSPEPGTRVPFTFAYASDSRNGQGGGERNVYGANFYIMKKIGALATQQNAAFMQFSGDLINGYLTSTDEINLQYANWKRSVEPFRHHLPFYVSMGNHEALMRVFRHAESRETVTIDRFPFETESAEKVFREHFSQAENGPISEDGASYDPDPNQTDFPLYRENVFYYTYDNVGVVVLNSNYWYAPSQRNTPFSSGGLHAYILDNQVAWLKETLNELESNEAIDHVFITLHTPFFPNGGHVHDDMWYNGDNTYRPSVAGKPVEKGIIERRDELLDLLVNESSKVVATLTGDEHNYARTEIGPTTNIYLDTYPEEKRIQLKRTIYQINNGAAGAPYYSQEQTPWTPNVTGFTTRNALVLFDINGKKVSMRVINPDTLEEFDQFELR